MSWHKEDYSSAAAAVGRFVLAHWLAFAIAGGCVALVLFGYSLHK